jgi:glutamate--cysteine ligase
VSFKVQTKDQLDSYICHNWNDINKYISDLKINLPIPFYSSVDIRESNVKYAPVDHNMYPAGFNNVCSMDLKDALPIFKATILKLNQNAKHVGIIPESHTKNLFYLDHLHSLSQLVKASGFELIILTFDQSLFEGEQTLLNLTSHSGHEVIIHKAFVKDHLIYANNVLIDTVIMNNDQSNPLPIDWKNLNTKISPTPLIGWFRRQKNTHFNYYKKVIDEFCAHFSINPDLLQAKFRAVENIDFESKEGLEKLAESVDNLKKELGPESKMFVKASQGTYGMGISVVSSGEEILNMNRKTRNKMDVGKNSIKFTSALVQEGVETIIKHDSHPAEITIYLIDGECIGGFIRANTEKDSLGNLNSKGMIFKKICITDIGQDDESKCKEAIYAIIARMACIAAALEIKEVI